MKQFSLSEQLRRNQMFAQGFLWCSICEQFKLIKSFYRIRKPKKQSTNYGYMYVCIECIDTKVRNKERQKKYINKRNSDLKRQFVDLAGGCCQRCGFSEFVTAMEFHHVYPSEKKHTPTLLIYRNNFKKTWQELDKCCLLCATCHKAYEGSEWRAEFIKRDGLGWTVGESLPLDDDRYNQKPVQIQQSAFPIHLLRNEPVQLSF